MIGKQSVSLVDRMIRAARLDRNLYIQVLDDVTALRQALFVVLIYSVCIGIGSGLVNIPDIEPWQFLINLSVVLFSALIFWFIWSLVTYLIGTTIFKGPEAQWRVIASYSELLRAIGFAAAPGVLMIFVFIPIIGMFISIVSWIWMFIATVIAVREALDFSTLRATGTCIVGGVLYLTLIIALILVLGLGSTVVSW